MFFLSFCAIYTILGVISKADDVEILGRSSKLRSSISSIEMYHKEVPKAMAGDSLGVLLRGVNRESLNRGMVIVKPGTYKLTTKFDAQVYILSQKEGGRHTPFTVGFTPTIFSRMSSIPGRIDALPEGKEMVMPGENCHITFKMMFKTPIEEGSRFTLRNSGKTIGTGVVVKTIE